MIYNSSMSSTERLKRFLAPALVIILPLAFAAGIHAKPDSLIKASEKLYSLPGLKNVGRLEPGLFRGAQPDKDGYQTLKEMGVKTVLSFRNNHDESSEVLAAGMKPLRVRMNMLKNPDPKQVRQALAIMSDTELRPLYFHCALGEDRTGTLAAVYRMEKHGWTLEAAMDEMQDFGFNDIWMGYKKFVKSYADGTGK